MRNKASLTVIFLTIFIDLMGFGILIPILPSFASKELGISDFGIGIIVASFSFMQFLFNPILGKLSDNIGRKPLIAATLLLTSFSYVVFSFAHSFFLLLLSRVLAGIGGSNIGVAQAYIADITPPEERIKGMGLIGVAFGLGFVFGPLIGAFVSKLGYSFTGLCSACFSFVAFLFALVILPESKDVKKERINLKVKLFDMFFIKNVFKIPFVGFLIFIFFIIIFSIANLYGTFALLGYKFYHFSDQQNGILFVIMGIVGVLVQGILVNIVENKLTEKTMLLIGLFFMFIGLGLIPYGHNFLGVIIVISVLSIGTGILQPLVLSMISKYSDPSLQGSILGVNQSFSALARVLGPLWGGFSYEYLGYKAPFLTGAIFTFIIFVIVLFNPKFTVN
ncbi:MAG: MFS transporter [Melioribacter sp.]|nr:MFS transporter [Melioribacter sp.]